MSIRIMSEIWRSGPDNPSHRLVLLAIADHADDEGRAYPSITGLATKCAMTERGVRGVVRKLEAAGWLDTRIGGGRGGKSHYTVNPEPRSPITDENPERQTGNDIPGLDAKPGTRVQKTRNDVPPNHQEPSITSLKEGAREIREVMCEWATPAAADSFIAYRRRQKGKALSLTAAKRLAASLRTIFDAGGDPDDALGMAEERGWQTVKPDWYFRARGADGTDHRGQRCNADDPTLRAITTAARMRQA